MRSQDGTGSDLDDEPSLYESETSEENLSNVFPSE